MSPYYNLPLEQRRLRHLVAQFNCDEQLWLSLGSERCRRRKLYPWMSARLQKQLDLLEFVSSQPPQDCVGFWQAKTTVN